MFVEANVRPIKNGFKETEQTVQRPQDRERKTVKRVAKELQAETDSAEGWRKKRTL